MEHHHPFFIGDSSQDEWFSIEKAEDSVEISGFSGFIVGLAFLPYTFYALLTAFNVVR